MAAEVQKLEYATFQAESVLYDCDHCKMIDL